METTTLHVNESGAKLLIKEPNSGFIVENPDTNIIKINKCTTQLNLNTPKLKILSVGIAGPQGQQGPVGTDLNYVHVQGMSSALWTITHNLHKKPSVTVVDSADSVVIGSVEYIDEDTLQISFSAPFGGKAYMN